MTSTKWTRIAAPGLALTAVIALATFAPATMAPAQAVPVHPVAIWGASPATVTGDAGANGVTDQSVRNLVHTSLGGSGVRITLSNAFGDRPVTFGSAHLGLAGVGAGVVPGTNRPVTFDGSGTVTVAPGEEVLSDPVDATVPADTTLAVSFHVVGESGPITGHNVAMQTSYVAGASGDVAGDESGEAFTTQISSWYWVESVVIQKPRRVKTAVLFGDSITDGNESTPGANRRWPDVLADRVATSRLTGQFGVMNQGISANRVLGDSVGGGQSALGRFERDVLQQPGVSTVVLLEGINDIRWDLADEASDLVTAYRELIDRAHARDVCVVGATLTPYEGGSRYTPDREQVRVAVNEWIRSSGEFDGVVDFDAATRDPARPSRFLPAYDSGDHLHPGDAGYAAMAEEFDLSLLECDR